MRRLQNAWMDLYRDLPAPQSVEFTNTLTAQQRAEIAAMDAEDRPDAVQEFWNQRTEAARQAHQVAFPLPGNLIAMIFIVQADLNEQQRQPLVSAISAQNIPMENCENQAVKTQFLQLSSVSRTSMFEDFYARRNIGPIALGPRTPWPYKKPVTLMVNSLADDPALADVTYRQLVRQACLARNSSVTYGGVTPLEMAFTRRLQAS